MSLLASEHVAATQMFIDANPNSFSLQRPYRAPDGAGGFVEQGVTDLSPQTMRLVGLNLRSAAATRVSGDGQIVVPQFTLIAPPSADIAVGDRFMFEGKVHEVVFTSAHPEWRTAAEVFRHA